MSEEKFPSELSLVIVEDLFKHYDLGFEDGGDTLHIYCDRCEDIVGTMPYKDTSELEELDLYERIIDTHREI